MYALVTLFSALSFLLYGTTCLTTAHMRREFARYGLPRQRVLTGILQLLGAVGLLAGLVFPPLGQWAAGGLALLMVLGFGVRLKIRDSLLQALPAFFYLVLALYLCLAPMVSDLSGTP